MEIKHPEVSVKLAGEDGKAFSIIGRTSQAMRRQGLDAEVIQAYQAEATSGDYDDLLRTTMQWVSCDEDPDDVDHSSIRPDNAADFSTNIPPRTID